MSKLQTSGTIQLEIRYDSILWDKFANSSLTADGVIPIKVRLEKSYIAYGKPTPLGLSRGNTRAIYCKNYEEIINKYRTAEQIEVIDSSSKFRR